MIAPMCQYSADEGSATDWHLIHLGHLALSGAAMLIVEATAVSRRGPDHADRPRPVQRRQRSRARPRARRACAPTRRSGWRCSSAARRPQGLEPRALGRRPQIRLGEPGSWRAVAPSAVPHGDGEDPPRGARCRRPAEDPRRLRRAPPGAPSGSASMRSRSMPRTATCCTSSSRRSPTSATTNTAAASRTGCASRSRSSTSCAPRSRRGKPVWARISATDWVPGGWDIEGTVRPRRRRSRRAAAPRSTSPAAASRRSRRFRLGPGYQVPFAQRVKAEVGLPTIAVGLITDPEQAEAIVAGGEADAVSLARAMLYDPRWPWHAAAGSARASRRRTSTGARSRANSRTCSRTRASARADRAAPRDRHGDRAGKPLAARPRPARIMGPTRRPR